MPAPALELTLCLARNFFLLVTEEKILQWSGVSFEPSMDPGSAACAKYVCLVVTQHY